MNKETEIKQQKHFPLINLEPISPKQFVDNLLQKKYHLNEKVKYFTLGKVYLKTNTQTVPFRIFKDKDLGLSLEFQKKINEVVLDDDTRTTTSQINSAIQKNQMDLVTSIYKREKWIEETTCSLSQMEKSLFLDEIEDNSE